jgi:hypothetical protein
MPCSSCTVHYHSLNARVTRRWHVQTSLSSTWRVSHASLAFGTVVCVALTKDLGPLRALLCGRGADTAATLVPLKADQDVSHASAPHAALLRVIQRLPGHVSVSLAALTMSLCGPASCPQATRLAGMEAEEHANNELMALELLPSLSKNKPTCSPPASAPSDGSEVAPDEGKTSSEASAVPLALDMTLHVSHATLAPPPTGPKPPHQQFECLSCAQSFGQRLASLTGLSRSSHSFPSHYSAAAMHASTTSASEATGDTFFDASEDLCPCAPHKGPTSPLPTAPDSLAAELITQVGGVRCRALGYSCTVSASSARWHAALHMQAAAGGPPEAAREPAVDTVLSVDEAAADVDLVHLSVGLVSLTDALKPLAPFPPSIRASTFQLTPRPISETPSEGCTLKHKQLRVLLDDEARDSGGSASMKMKWSATVQLERGCRFCARSMPEERAASEGARTGNELVAHADSASMTLRAAPTAPVATSGLTSPAPCASRLVSPAGTDACSIPEATNPLETPVETESHRSGGSGCSSPLPMQDTRHKLLSQLAGGQSLLQRSASSIVMRESACGPSRPLSQPLSDASLTYRSCRGVPPSLPRNQHWPHELHCTMRIKRDHDCNLTWMQQQP